MKNGLRAASMTIAIAILSTATARAEVGNKGVSFRVERSDTYINLFGPDWEKAYRQNKMTVMRGGRPINSPDILLEGSIITVSEDVRLSPRAWARVNALQQRRAQLVAQLDALEPKLAGMPQMQATAAECRHLLQNSLRFAPDVEFVAREVAHLERLMQHQLLPVPRPRTGPGWWIVLLLMVGTALAVALLRRRQRRQYPEGATRYREALADLNKSVLPM